MPFAGHGGSSPPSDTVNTLVRRTCSRSAACRLRCSRSAATVPVSSVTIHTAPPPPLLPASAIGQGRLLLIKRQRLQTQYTSCLSSSQWLCHWCLPTRQSSRPVPMLSTFSQMRSGSSGGCLRAAWVGNSTLRCVYRSAAAPSAGRGHRPPQHGPRTRSAPRSQETGAPVCVRQESTQERPSRPPGSHRTEPPGSLHLPGS